MNDYFYTPDYLLTYFPVSTTQDNVYGLKNIYKVLNAMKYELHCEVECELMRLRSTRDTIVDSGYKRKDKDIQTVKTKRYFEVCN